MRVLFRHRTAEPVPLFWAASALVGLGLGVVADLTLGWVWWLVTAGFLVLVWLVFLATALRSPEREDLWIDLVATVSPQRAKELEKRRFLHRLENTPGPVYGLTEWDGPRRIGGHGRSATEGLTHLELVYGSSLDQPHVKVNTIWPSNQPSMSIQDARRRLTRALWQAQLHPPEHLDDGERPTWMRQQQAVLDHRPIPDWMSMSVQIEGDSRRAELYREGEDWVAVVEMDRALMGITSHQVPTDRLTLGPVTDLTTYVTGPPGRESVAP